jgi:hypothetical protein
LAALKIANLARRSEEEKGLSTPATGLQARRQHHGREPVRRPGNLDDPSDRSATRIPEWQNAMAIAAYCDISGGHSGSGTPVDQRDKIPAKRPLLTEKKSPSEAQW